MCNVRCTIQSVFCFHQVSCSATVSLAEWSFRKSLLSLPPRSGMASQYPKGSLLTTDDHCHTANIPRLFSSLPFLEWIAPEAYYRPITIGFWSLGTPTPPDNVSCAIHFWKQAAAVCSSLEQWTPHPLGHLMTSSLYCPLVCKYCLIPFPFLFPQRHKTCIKDPATS